jgi:hypothetical protein
MRRVRELICTLAVHQRVAQGLRWKQLLRRPGVRAEVVDRGIALRFAEPRAWPSLERLVERERRCCRWMDLEIQTVGGALVLSITSDTREGTQAIRTMFGRTS